MDNLERLEKIWHTLHAWQRTFLLTGGLLSTLNNSKRQRPAGTLTHWGSPSAHWI